MKDIRRTRTASRRADSARSTKHIGKINHAIRVAGTVDPKGELSSALKRADALDTRLREVREMCEKNLAVVIQSERETDRGLVLIRAEYQAQAQVWRAVLARLTA